MRGTVKMWNESRGFGFITPDDGGTALFVHARQLSGGLDTLRSRAEVIFTIGQSQRTGLVEAQNVVLA